MEVTGLPYIGVGSGKALLQTIQDGLPGIAAAGSAGLPVVLQPSYARNRLAWFRIRDDERWARGREFGEYVLQLRGGRESGLHVLNPGIWRVP